MISTSPVAPPHSTVILSGRGSGRTPVVACLWVHVDPLTGAGCISTTWVEFSSTQQHINTKRFSSFPAQTKCWTHSLSCQIHTWLTATFRSNQRTRSFSIVLPEEQNDRFGLIMSRRKTYKAPSNDGAVTLVRSAVYILATSPRFVARCLLSTLNEARYNHPRRLTLILCQASGM